MKPNHRHERKKRDNFMQSIRSIVLTVSLHHPTLISKPNHK